jgi:hypothetical protein
MCKRIQSCACIKMLACVREIFCWVQTVTRLATRTQRTFLTYSMCRRILTCACIKTSAYESMCGGLFDRTEYCGQSMRNCAILSVCFCEVSASHPYFIS